MSEEGMVRCDPSLQRISMLMSVAEQMDELPKPCLMSAEDVSVSTSSTEIERFSDLATANEMLKSLIDYETGLQRAFEHPRSTTIQREKSRSDVALSGKRAMREDKKAEQLPQLDEFENSSLLYNGCTSFVDLMGFTETSVMGFSLSHPLSKPHDFNGAMSEIVHLLHATQIAFSAEPEYVLVPIPSASMIQFNGELRRLWFDVSKSQSSEVQALQESLTHFLTLCWSVMNTAIMRIPTELPFASFEEMNIAPLISERDREEEWSKTSKNLISAAKFLAYVLQEKCKSLDVVYNQEEIPDLLIIDEHGKSIE